MKKKLMNFREKILRFFKYDFETILTFGIKLEQPYLRLCVGYISYQYQPTKIKINRSLFLNT